MAARERAEVRRLGEMLRSVLPCAMGLACTRIGYAVTASGTYMGTGDGIFSDGASVIVVGILLVLAVFLARLKRPLSSKTLKGLLFAAVTVFTLCALVMGLFRIIGICTPERRLTMSAVMTIASAFLFAHWLRAAKDAPSAAVVVFIFAGCMISEVVVYAISFAPYGWRCLASVPFALAQIPCAILVAKRHETMGRADNAGSDDFFFFARTGGASSKFLVTASVALAMLAVVTGFLRGYPDENPVSFSHAMSFACLVVLELIYAAFLYAAAHRRGRAMTLGVWVVMELLAALAIVAYALFPGHPALGAITAAALNALMSAYCWYVIVAFMAVGWRDPYCYAIGVWAVWSGFRAIGRFLVVPAMPSWADSHVAGAVMSLVLLVSTQIVFVRIVDIVSHRLREEAGLGNPAAEGVGLMVGVQSDAVSSEVAADESSVVASPELVVKTAVAVDMVDARLAGPKRQSGLIEHILGIDDAPSLADVRHATTDHNAAEIGRQFMLSNREVEVLSLYALGYTQKRISEDLGVSQTTVHTHIKRIYAKTGFHSRQEVLDYMSRYTD